MLKLWELLSRGKIGHTHKAVGAALPGLLRQIPEQLVMFCWPGPGLLQSLCSFPEKSSVLQRAPIAALGGEALEGEGTFVEDWDWELSLLACRLSVKTLSGKSVHAEYPISLEKRTSFLP